MAQTSIGIKKSSSSFLPAPKWELSGVSAKTIVNGNIFLGTTVNARVQLFDKDLISKIPNLRVEFGLVRGKRYSNRPNPRRTGNRIRAWSNWDGGTSVTGTGFGGGVHTQGGIMMLPRPNRLSFTNPNELVGELPYSAFYSEYPGDALTSFGVQYGVSNFLALTGSKRKNVRDPSGYLPAGSFYRKTPQDINKFTNSRHIVSEWHVRLIELDNNGRLVNTSDWSEPVFITPTSVGYNSELSEGVIHPLSNASPFTFVARIGRRRF